MPRAGRVTVLPAAADEGLCAATGRALAAAAGEFVTFLDGRDLLAPAALYKVAEL